MAAPAVYLDECIDEPLIEALRRRGYSLVPAREAGALGLSDETQIDYATELGIPIFSYNRRHFRRLHARLMREDRKHPGIIVLPQDAPLPRRLLRAELLLQWVGEHERESRLFTWGELQQELLRGYRIPGVLFSEEDVRTAVGL